MKRLYPIAFVTNVIGLAAYYIYPATQPNIMKELDESEKKKMKNNGSNEKDVELNLENIE